MRRLILYLVLLPVLAAGCILSSRYIRLRLSAPRHEHFCQAFSIMEHTGGYTYTELTTDTGTYYLPDLHISHTAYDTHVEAEGAGIILTAERRSDSLLRSRHILRWQPRMPISLTTTCTVCNIQIGTLESSTLPPMAISCFFTSAMEEHTLRERLESAAPGSAERAWLLQKLRTNLSERLHDARKFKDRDSEQYLLQSLSELDTM